MSESRIRNREAPLGQISRWCSSKAADLSEDSRSFTYVSTQDRADELWASFAGRDRELPSESISVSDRLTPHQSHSLVLLHLSTCVDVVQPISNRWLRRYVVE
jgi:hypothetical protein